MHAFSTSNVPTLHHPKQSLLDCQHPGGPIGLLCRNGGLSVADAGPPLPPRKDQFGQGPGGGSAAAPPGPPRPPPGGRPGPQVGRLPHPCPRRGSPPLTRCCHLYCTSRRAQHSFHPIPILSTKFQNFLYFFFFQNHTSQPHMHVAHPFAGCLPTCSDQKPVIPVLPFQTLLPPLETSHTNKGYILLSLKSISQ